jgi:hypothetical protein
MDLRLLSTRWALLVFGISKYPSSAKLLNVHEQQK